MVLRTRGLAFSIGAAATLALTGCASAPPATGEFNVIGAENAPVVMIEFTDLQCPYCARFAAQTFPQLRRHYVDKGKLRYASRDLPLPMHQFAVPAAVAARCAGEQGRFWPYREAVFAAQETLGREPYEDLAQKLGLDLERFATCRTDGVQLRHVQEDARLAAQYGLAATPSFVIGRLVDGEFKGETFSGAQPYEVVAAKIDALLAQQGQVSR
jgi:protein-disulfide isomerase